MEHPERGRRFHLATGVFFLFALTLTAQSGLAATRLSEVRAVKTAATDTNLPGPGHLGQLTYTAVHTSYEPDATLSATISETVTETVEAVRWDIILLTPGPAINPGGVASAKATNPLQTVETSTITVTGSGTFEVPEKGRGRERDEGRGHVTGGGTWMTTTGAITATGTYKVTGLVRWTEAPGTLAITDNIGNPADLRAGLAVLRIVYSDGSLGTLTVSCSLGGTPTTVSEGITATKDFTDYWKRQAPSGSPGGANANRTAFHVIHEDGDRHEGRSREDSR